MHGCPKNTSIPLMQKSLLLELYYQVYMLFCNIHRIALYYSNSVYLQMYLHTSGRARSTQVFYIIHRTNTQNDVETIELLLYLISTTVQVPD